MTPGQWLVALALATVVAAVVTAGLVWWILWS